MMKQMPTIPEIPMSLLKKTPQYQKLLAEETIKSVEQMLVSVTTMYNKTDPKNLAQSMLVQLALMECSNAILRNEAKLQKMN